MALAAALVLACSCAAAAPDAAAAHFAREIQPIFDAHCVVCHQAGVEQAGLNLEEGEAYANLVGVQSTQSRLVRVAPGSPAQSYLLHKLRGTQAAVGGSGARMPLAEGGSSTLPDAQQTLLENWIARGAPND
ncbi:MAG: hypothetical protein AB7I32_02095 [Gammaproteobacteria bacterium]